jgi:succinate semialdehyde reductase
MFSIRQPSLIHFGKNSAKNYSFPKNCLLITSKGTKSRNWIEYIGFDHGQIFDAVEPNPSMNTVERILSMYDLSKISCVVGLGGGSSLDVAKYVGFKLKNQKILIPTTFGSGSEVTRISVLKVNEKKKSFHDDNLLANIAIIDPFFIQNAPEKIIKNSAIDACAQCTEAYDSKLANNYTRLFCKKAFDILEKAIIDEKYEDLASGAMISGLGFGNSSTTLGHALSYVFSNEGISHGHALAFTTTIAHKFNNSQFYYRFKNLVDNFNFESIHLTQNLEDASDSIFLDRKHLDFNPIPVSKKNIIDLLKEIIKN